MKILKSKQSSDDQPEFFGVEASQYENHILPITDNILSHNLHGDSRSIMDLENWYDLDLIDYELVKIKLIIDK